MSIDFLEKYKVMLSLLAVIAVGGILIAGTFQPSERGDEEAAQALTEKPAKVSPESTQTDAGWAAATSFDDMLDDETMEPDDNGFAKSSTLAPSEEGKNSDFNEPSIGSDETIFRTAASSSSRYRESADVPKRIIVQENRELNTPIPVDPRRVSRAAGGKGGESYDDSE